MNDVEKKKDCFVVDNEDWAVTKEIYSNSLVEDGTLDIKLRLDDCVGIRRVHRDGEGSGCKAAPLFEYCTLEFFRTPTIRVSFQYVNDKVDEYILDAVKIDLRYTAIGDDYPLPELSSSHSHHIDDECETSYKSKESGDTTTIHSKWLHWLQSSANDILEEAQLSYSICDFIEHQAITFFNIIHKHDALGYTAILFDDHKKLNDGNIIRVHDDVHDDESNTTAAAEAPYEAGAVQYTSSSWRGSKLHLTTFQCKKKKMKADHLSLDEYAVQTIQNHWKEWMYFECPVCFDKFKCDSEGVELPCRHFLCLTCVELYIQSLCSELRSFRHSPFICPIVSCKKPMKIRSCNYPISKENMDVINMWRYDLTFPQTHLLSTCPRKSCRSQNMRKVSSGLTETMVFCGTCTKAFCEICLNKYDDKECRSEHDLHNCDERAALRLCRRYRNASEEIKAKADEKWHWLKEYASARDDDITAKLWINENASTCPRCKTGIERIEGCFHMNCTLCGTHFCYECGEELFYPYYGTHHCWEQGGQFDFG